jgi:hypothetical protein
MPDPDAMLALIRELISEFEAATDDSEQARVAESIVVRFNALDEDISRGGPLPEPWRFNDLRLHRDRPGPPFAE